MFTLRMTARRSESERAAFWDGYWTALLGVIAVCGVLALVSCAPVARPPAQPPVTPPARTCSVVVSVFAGDPVLDRKVAGAEVFFGSLRATADDAGNATFGPIVDSPFLWVVSASADGYTRPETSGTVTAIAPCTTTAVSISLTPIPPQAPKAVRGRLRVDGRHLVYPGGAPFVWRGATGFLLAEQIVRGREDEATAFLAWASRTGFNVVRILAMLPGGWEDGHAFSAAEGLAALPRVFDMAAAADVYVHLTVLNNTAQLPGADLGAIVEAAGRVCAAAPNCALLEVANEPYHGVQRSDVHDASVLAAWATRVPAGVLVALGPAPDDESLEMAGGQVVTVHLDRSRDMWNMVRRVREIENVSTATGKPALNTEPDGFAEVSCVPRAVGCYKRQTDPSLAFAFGALSRVFTVGTTFHFEAGLRARVPGPVQQTAAEAFIAGTRIVPDTTVLSFRNAGWAGSPVLKARWAEGEPTRDATVRAYSGISGDTGVLVLVGVQGDPGVEFGSGWLAGTVIADRPGVRVLEIRR